MPVLPYQVIASKALAAEADLTFDHNIFEINSDDELVKIDARSFRSVWNAIKYKIQAQEDAALDFACGEKDV